MEPALPLMSNKNNYQVSLLYVEQYYDLKSVEPVVSFFRHFFLQLRRP